jgi:hypothetical protein
MPNQITTAITATMIAAQIAGMTFFELPLRGESLAAWFEFSFHDRPANSPSPENSTQLFPERLIVDFAVSLRRRRLRGAQGVGRRKTALQPGVELLVHFPIGQKRLAGVAGMLVMRRRIEFLSHVCSPLQR